MLLHVMCVRNKPNILCLVNILMFLQSSRNCCRVFRKSAWRKYAKNVGMISCLNALRPGAVHRELCYTLGNLVLLLNCKIRCPIVCNHNTTFLFCHLTPELKIRYVRYVFSSCLVLKLISVSQACSDRSSLVDEPPAVCVWEWERDMDESSEVDESMLSFYHFSLYTMSHSISLRELARFTLGLGPRCSSYVHWISNFSRRN